MRSRGGAVPTPTLTSTLAPDRLRLRNILFESVMCFAHEGRICMPFLEIICADIAFKFCRHTHIHVTGGGEPWTSKVDPRGPNVATPKSARKWHKIVIFLDITRQQSSAYWQKFGLYYLLGRKQAKSDCFSEIGVPI